ncbi:ADP-ribosylation factor GTPase-activating protein 3, partial [Geodia barretti]
PRCPLFRGFTLFYDVIQVGPVQTTQSRVDDLTAPRSSHKYSSYGAGNEDFFDSFYPPSYTDYSSSSGSSRGVTSGGSSRSFGKHSAFADSAGSEPKPSSKVSSFGSFQSGGSDSSRASRSSNRPSRGGRYSEEAQQRFSSAKSISSDQYFGRSSADDSEGGAKLSQFTGSSAISSDDYFGRNPKKDKDAEGPDFSQLKDGMANLGSKLSSVANNMFETIQVSHEAYIILLNCEIFSCCFRIDIGSDATFLTFDLLHLFPAVTVALSSKIK